MSGSLPRALARRIRAKTRRRLALLRHGVSARGAFGSLGMLMLFLSTVVLMVAAVAVMMMAVLRSPAAPTARPRQLFAPDGLREESAALRQRLLTEVGVRDGRFCCDSLVWVVRQHRVEQRERLLTKREMRSWN
eukprot:6184084-Pleurochrysis_carterae.AAC.1